MEESASAKVLGQGRDQACWGGPRQRGMVKSCLAAFGNRVEGLGGRRKLNWVLWLERHLQHFPSSSGQIRFILITEFLALP